MRSRVWLWRLSLLTIVFSAGAGILLLQAAQHDELSVLQSELESIQLIFGVSRLVAIAALIASWPLIVRQVAKIGLISSATAKLLHSVRWRFARLLLILEFVIGLNGPETVTELLWKLLP